MKVVVQRVTEASAAAGTESLGEIGAGMLLFVGIEKGDSDEDLQYMLKKVPNLRIFEDDSGKMNRPVRETGGGILVISQFTLAADCRKGNRPSFDNAEEPEKALAIYERFVEGLRAQGCSVSTGKFGEYMRVRLVNDGPVTIVLESRQ